jgi:hypothetical protein
MAVVHLRRNETEESLRIWLEILDGDPKNRYARRGLEIVRDNTGAENGGEGLEKLFEGRKDLVLVPSPGFFLPAWVKAVGIGLLLMFVLVPAALIVKDKFLRDPEPSRPEIAAIKIETTDVVLDTENRAAIMLTEQEVRTTFGKIKELFDLYQDNLARREINRLLLSNAGQTVRDKARSLIPYITVPTFANFPSSFTYQDVMADPALYEGCFVRWKGRISKIEITQNRINLDFLVGYDDQKVLLGIVPAWMEFAAALEQTFAYEVIGRIALSQRQPGIMLQIISLHELGL